MTILDILTLCLRYGDRVHLFLEKKDENGQSVEKDAFFAGFRRYEDGIIRDFNGLFPVFHEVNAQGKMSNRLLDGVRSWSPEAITAIRKTEEPRIDPQSVPALTELQRTLQNESLCAIKSVMQRFAAMHPGRPKLWFGNDDSVSCIFEGKYSSSGGTVNAVSYVDGHLFYDIHLDDGDYEKDVPDIFDVCRNGVYVENKLFLLESILGAIKAPAWPDADSCDPDGERFFDYIVPGARLRWNDTDKFRLYCGKSGPAVTVTMVPSGPIAYDSIIGISFEGKNVKVQACELEPMEK